MKLKIIQLILLFYCFFSFSQSDKVSIKEYINFSDLPKQTSQTPSWAIPLYTNPDGINIYQMRKEIDIWMKSEEAKKYGKEILIKEKKAEKKENDFDNEKLKESISEIPIVRFALNFIKKVPSNWIDTKGNINLPLKSNFLKTANKLEELNQKTKDINKTTTSASWSQIGPMETVRSNGVQGVGQVNVYYISIAPSSTNIRLASTETGALFKTTDSGDNWSFVADYNGPSAFNPLNSNQIILGSNPFRKSTDGGLTWQVKPVIAACNEILWANNGTTIIAATEQGVFVSNDAGTNFSNNLNGNFMDVEFQPGSSTVAYAIDNRGKFYKSINAGQTWTLKTTNYSLTTVKDGFLLGVSAANPNLVSIAFLTGEYVELIKSVDGGEIFSPLSVYNTGFSQGYYDFVFGISPLNENTYFLGVTTFFKSTDGGITFSPIGGYYGSFPIHPDIQDLDFFGNNVLLATDGGVSISSDGFNDISNWHSTNKGIYAMDLWEFDLGFNTDQMGSGKYHNGDNIFNPNWNNGKTIILGGAEDAAGKTIFSRPNAMYFRDLSSGFKQIDTEFNTNVVDTYPFSIPSNTYYYGLRNSNLTSNVKYSNIIYGAIGNDLVVSYDNGATNQVLRGFNSKVWDIKTSRQNPNVLYVMTETDGLWKTTDGGVNWTICSSILNGTNQINNGINCQIDVSQTNSNEIWLGYAYWNGAYENNNSYRIFKSTDGGQTWNSLDTNVLSQFTVLQMVHQYGSNGGIYLLGNDANNVAKCYYRNNSMTDWVDYSNGLMPSTAIYTFVYLRLSHYKEKIRVAGPRGVQEVDFYEHSTPIAQPTTNIKEVCINQEIKLADYSILNYNGATWQWAFSKTPVYLNGTNATSQNPELKFLTPGSVDATLTVTDGFGNSDNKTITNFLNINYDSASCLQLNSDQDLQISCVNNIPSSSNIAPGSQTVITDFDGATSGNFLVKINFYTNCYGVVGHMVAIVNLTENKINVIQYRHFADYSTGFLGNNTNVVTSLSDGFAKISFTLTSGVLYLNHIYNACGSGTSIALQESCWKPYTGIDNGDSFEIQKCNNIIPQSSPVLGNADVLVTDFNNATTGLFFVNVTTSTSCTTSSNNIKAIVNLNSDTINVLAYKHFNQVTTSAVNGNETSSATSVLTTSGQVNYFLSNNKLYARKIYDPCGNSNFSINSSCWSSMDDDGNGVDNIVQPSTCNNPLSTAQIVDSNTHQVFVFPLNSGQSSVFVKLNVFTNCNNTTAKAYLNIDLENNLIHVINYSHFGSTVSDIVLNNDSANVYSESSVNGKLKFILINKVLYIQRLSTTCSGSYYEITNSCYSLATDEMLAINNFASNTVSNVVAYPNPTTGLFSIKAKEDVKNYSFSFYTIDGKFITPNYKEINENKLQVNLEGFSNGLYFAIIYNKNDKTYDYLKIIKK